jgi:expansin (peptidoglycan-binding protein)
VHPTYFAAYDSTPPDSLYCGLCVQISYGSNTILATIVDDCPDCSGGAGHLDLGMSAANALGLSAANGYPMTGVTWHAVSCPVMGNIVASYNAGVTSQVYFQNVVFPVTAATSGGHTAMQAYGFWDFMTDVSGQSVTLTDALGHTVTGTVPTNGGDIGVQFPNSCD